MDNNSDNCTHPVSTSITYILLVVGTTQIVACIVTLIIVLVISFYKDIIQRLIVYKLLTMLVFSVVQLLYPIFSKYDSSKLHKIVVLLVPSVATITYSINIGFTFWLTIVLYLCIVHLKELRNLRKLELISIMTSAVPLFFVVFIPFASYDDCMQTWEVVFSNGGGNRLEYIYITGYCISGVVYLIISTLLISIFIKVALKSRPNQERDDVLPLLTTNKWKTLLKQLLPIVIYVIAITILAVIYFLFSVINYNKMNLRSNGVLTVAIFCLASSFGFLTSLVILLFICILKCKSKMKRIKGKGLLDYAEKIVHDTAYDNSNVFTSETIASTNVKTEYYYTRMSSSTSKL
uniref:G-protein coupled receptors family 1 profile domain-containing protein n=1 Tax=Amphimedon queenslandica TaxID=400682 RepID=A0A1X7UFY9_AMPQE